MKAPSVSLYLALMLLSGCIRPGDGYESGADKREWSVLQGLEFSHRREKIDTIEFSHHAEYWIVCVPRHDDHARIWIMMDPASPPFYKQMPEGNFWLTKEQIEEIRRKTNPISTVLEALKSHTKI